MRDRKHHKLLTDAQSATLDVADMIETDLHELQTSDWHKSEWSETVVERGLKVK